MTCPCGKPATVFLCRECEEQAQTAMRHAEARLNIPRWMPIPADFKPVAGDEWYIDQKGQRWLKVKGL